MASYWELPRISTEFTYRGIEAALMENKHLRIMVLPGKGGDILEFRDKHADVDVLFHTDHNWQPPGSRYVPSVHPTTYMDHYPGGWQMNLPVAGYTDELAGTPYGLHGESALIPWDARVVQDDEEAVRLRLETELVRYPFEVTRTFTLPADERRLDIDESITNTGNLEVEYIWQQHVALGTPLVGPDARLDLPAETGIVEDYGETYRNPRLQSNERFEWPRAPGRDGNTVDLRRFPPLDANLHDVVFATELREGWYAVTNSDLNLGFALQFPTDPFECVWYWQAFRGHEESPYFSRNYNVGLEPTTAYPSASIPEAQRENGTLDVLAPGETIEAEYRALTYSGMESVDTLSTRGEVRGRPVET